MCFVTNHFNSTDIKRLVQYRICGGKKLKILYQQNSYFALSQGKNLRLPTVTNGPQTVCKNGQQFPAIVGNYAIPSENLLLTTVTSM